MCQSKKSELERIFLHSRENKERLSTLKPKEVTEKPLSTKHRKKVLVTFTEMPARKRDPSNSASSRSSSVSASESGSEIRNGGRAHRRPGPLRKLKKGQKPPKGIPRRRKTGQISKNGRYYGGDGDSSASNSDSEGFRMGGRRERAPGKLRKAPKGKKLAPVSAATVPRRNAKGQFSKTGRFRGGDSDSESTPTRGRRSGGKAQKARAQSASISRSLSQSENRTGGRRRKRSKSGRRRGRRGGVAAQSRSRSPSVSVSRSQSEVRAGGGRKKKRYPRLGKATSRTNYVKAAAKLGLMRRVPGTKLKAAPKKGTDAYKRIKHYMRTGKK